LKLVLLFSVAGGTEGLFAQKTLEITDEILSTYKNQGKGLNRMLFTQNLLT